MEKEQVPSALELDEQRRAPLARCMLDWLTDHELAKTRGAGASEASARLNWRGREITAALLRLQVCRGEQASKVANTLAGELALLAETYQQCAALPEAAERDLDAARAVTFRALARLLERQPTGNEPNTERRNGPARRPAAQRTRDQPNVFTDWEGISRIGLRAIGRRRTGQG